MQCPSCHAEDLISEGLGKLVCASCGEEFSGFQEEETDAVLAGTAVSNRQSQSQQAQSARERISVPSPLRTNARRSRRRPSKWRFCELVARAALDVLNLLIGEQLEKDELKKVLFCIWAYWTDHVHHIESSYTMLHVREHAYSLICLSCIHTRSSTLVRDVRRVALSSQSSLCQGEVYRKLVEQQAAPTRYVPSGLVPHAGKPEVFAQRHMQSDFSWPHVRSRFLRWSMDNSLRGVPTVPVGNQTIVCLRLCRLLGLPDEFGGRVLRYMELERAAIESETRKADAQASFASDARLGNAGRSFTSGFANESWRMSKLARSHEAPSDEHLLMAFLNTMRICYCTLPQGVKINRRAQSELRKLSAEFECCMKQMKHWARAGFFEDMYSINWSGLSPRSLSRSQARHVNAYAAIVNALLSEIAEEAPDMWGNFIKTFELIGLRATPCAEQQDGYVCSYDLWKKRHSCERSGQPCLSSSLGCEEGQGEMSTSSLSRDAYTGRFAELDADTREDEAMDAEDYRANKEDTAEGAVKDIMASDDIAFLALVCSIMRRFFSGQSCVALSSDPMLVDILFRANWKRKCKYSLDTVLAYLKDLKDYVE